MRLFVAVQDQAGDGKPSAMVRSDPLFPFRGHQRVTGLQFEKFDDRSQFLIAGRRM